MSAVLPVYRRSDIVIAKGEGAYLFSPEGTRYLDFASGIAVNALGHGHPHLVAALKTQADTLWHCSNMYRTEGLFRFADRLAALSFADQIFFGSSGSEAVEAGLKMIRKYHDATGNPERYRVITMSGGFHGRSLACISAGGNEVARNGYTPLVDGFDRATFNDLASVEALIGNQTAGILVEPLQGEGGINLATPEFLQGLRALADKHGLLLFFDEVQCGMGRMGSLFAYEQFGVTPDIMSVAKGIGGGFPLSACLVTAKVGAVMTPGSHGSTYGANPLAMAVGNAVLDVMLEAEFLPRVRRVGTYLEQGLRALVERFPQQLEQVRGKGLMLGLKVRTPLMPMVDALRAAGLLTAPCENNVIRLLPPLIIEQAHADEALSIIANVCEKWS
jgi:acetylornithine/N-succinyldiaminopimelate aminotransferase